MNDVRRVRLTGRAARWIDLLREFGHLDDESVEDLLIALADIEGTPKGVKLDVAPMRRLAAEVLFDIIEEPDRTVLREDWPVLFS